MQLTYARHFGTFAGTAEIQGFWQKLIIEIIDGTSAILGFNGFWFATC